MAQKKKFVLFALCGAPAKEDIFLVGLTPTKNINVSGRFDFTANEIGSLDENFELVAYKAPATLFVDCWNSNTKFQTSLATFFRQGDFSSVRVAVYEEGTLIPIQVWFEIRRDGGEVTWDITTSGLSATSIVQEANRLLEAEREQGNAPSTPHSPSAAPEAGASSYPKQKF